MNNQTPIIKNRDIVVISIQPWYYELGSNCKNIATYFSKNNRVLYVNIPITRKTFFSKKKSTGLVEHCQIIKEKGETIKAINKYMWQLFPTTLIESINWLPSSKIFSLINYLNNKRFANDIKKALKKLDFKDIILFNDNDIYNGYHLKKLISPSIYLYYCRDFLQGYSFWKKHASVLEPKLIKKADLVVTNSTYYAEYCSNYNRNSHYIGQGCNIELFDSNKKREIPEVMKQFSYPIIGYVGALDSARLDVNIITTIATANPAWTIVLVGPEDEYFIKSPLHSYKNVHFLGRQPLQHLPDYVGAFDVCINPQLVNTITQGNYPLKIDEYLAMGKPVVASRTSAMKLFEKFTYLANRPDEYPGLIEKALVDNKRNQEERIAFARSHTWENSMNELYKILAANLKEAANTN